MTQAWYAFVQFKHLSDDNEKNLSMVMDVLVQTKILFRKQCVGGSDSIAIYAFDEKDVRWAEYVIEKNLPICQLTMWFDRPFVQ